jgi:hypothetical protein
MPADRDYLGDTWVHEGAKLVDPCVGENTAIYACHDCGQMWRQPMPISRKGDVVNGPFDNPA